MVRRIVARFVIRRRAGWRWPEGVERTSWERLRIPSASGVELAGLFGRAHGPAKGAVVCVHPLGAAAKGFFLQSGRAHALRRGGFDVVLFDFDGFGESPQGDRNYAADLRAAAAYARKRAPCGALFAYADASVVRAVLEAVAREPIKRSVGSGMDRTFLARSPGSRRRC
jgi:pimeloyl-ACP methyl ester carboxylesterase